METVPERLTRAHDLIEEAVSLLEDVGADLDEWTILSTAANHCRTAMQWIGVRMRPGPMARRRQENKDARVL